MEKKGWRREEWMEERRRGEEVEERLTQLSYLSPSQGQLSVCKCVCVIGRGILCEEKREGKRENKKMRKCVCVIERGSL